MRYDAYLATPMVEDFRDEFSFAILRCIAEFVGRWWINQPRASGGAVYWVPEPFSLRPEHFLQFPSRGLIDDVALADAFLVG